MVVHQNRQSRSRQKQGRRLQTKGPALRPGKAGHQKQASGSILDQNSIARTRWPLFLRQKFFFPDRAGTNT